MIRWSSLWGIRIIVDRFTHCNSWLVEVVDSKKIFEVTVKQNLSSLPGQVV